MKKTISIPGRDSYGPVCHDLASAQAAFDAIEPITPEPKADPVETRGALVAALLARTLTRAQ